MIASPNIRGFNPDANSESFEMTSAHSLGKYGGIVPKGLIAT